MHAFSHGVHIQTSNLIAMGQMSAQLPLHKQRKVLTNRVGNQISAIRGRGMEFAEVRAYSAGDDVRQMDWRITARTQTPHIKLYQQEKERPVMLMLDLRANMRFASKRAFKSVLAADIAALLGWSSLNSGDHIGTWIFNDTQELDIRPKGRKTHLLTLFHQLSDFAQKPTQAQPAQARFEQMLRHLLRSHRPGSLIYLISDFYGFSSQCLPSLQTLSKRNDLIAIQIRDLLEQELPPAGQYRISDRHTNIQIDTQAASLRTKFAQQAKAQQQQLIEQLRQLSIAHIELFTHLPIMPALQSGLGISPQRGTPHA